MCQEMDHFERTEMDPMDRLQELQDAIREFAQSESRWLIKKYFRKMCMIISGLCEPGELYRIWRFEIHSLLNIIDCDINRNPFSYARDALSIVQQDLEDELLSIMQELEDASIKPKVTISEATDQSANIHKENNNGSSRVAENVDGTDTKSFTSVENNGLMEENIVEIFQSSQHIPALITNTAAAAAAVGQVATAGTPPLPPPQATVALPTGTGVPVIEVVGCNEVLGYEEGPCGVGDLENNGEYIILDVPIEEVCFGSRVSQAAQVSAASAAAAAAVAAVVIPMGTTREAPSPPLHPSPAGGRYRAKLEMHKCCNSKIIQPFCNDVNLDSVAVDVNWTPVEDISSVPIKYLFEESEGQLWHEFNESLNKLPTECSENIHIQVSNDRDKKMELLDPIHMVSHMLYSNISPVQRLCDSAVSFSNMRQSFSDVASFWKRIFFRSLQGGPNNGMLSEHWRHKWKMESIWKLFVQLML